ncbi:MAG: hypothetical protein QNJ12_17130 [Ilumatobacter sp.]|uniref:hypothetical protein n=1 Tax=Ilumatobacter sp. TaxID=1967498 RepID=UPI00260FF456|nr:hypothetical protein [Ilumatobacter sp.]MDJ0770520.1 hypothetical protein [Ilumatobacter sp.]
MTIAAALLVTMTAPAGADDDDSSSGGGAGGGAGEPPPEYYVDESKLPFDPLPGADAYWGVLRGAGYRVEVPEDWNGHLVMWAHGFRGTGLELTVDNHPIRDHLIAEGYAWAASSYTRNDYDVEAGMVDTRRLAKRFKRITGERPDLIYLTGASMGGHITAASIEQWPRLYDGAMPICGVVGDFELFDYFLDFNLAAQQIGLGTSSFPVDPAQYIGVDVPAIKANLEAVPGGWPNVLNADGQALKQLTELRSGGDRPNFDEAWFFWNFLAGDFLFELGLGDGTLPGRDGVVVDNVDAVYQTDLDPAISASEQALNDDILRVAFDPEARRIRGAKNVRAVEGDFRVPVMSLHNLGDLFVPFHNQVEYFEDASATGRGDDGSDDDSSDDGSDDDSSEGGGSSADLLVQRAIRGVGHCDFTQSELTTAFDDLAGWVEDGVKPAGDDVGNPAAVADPNFGCAFTDDPNNEHILATPCP